MPLNLELTYYIGMIYHFTSTSLFVAEIAGLEPTHRNGYRLLVVFKTTALPIRLISPFGGRGRIRTDGPLLANGAFQEH